MVPVGEKNCGCSILNWKSFEIACFLFGFLGPESYWKFMLKGLEIYT